jgi:hypothetical protein
MSAPSGIRTGVGFRNAVLFNLTEAGFPAASGSEVYEGVRVSGAKTLTINDPEPRRITHTGDDYIVSIDVLPPNEGISGELHTSKVNDIVDALLTGQKVFTAGEMSLFGQGTDKRGYEVQVGLLAYRQAQDTDPESATYGQRMWEIRIMPKVQLISRDSGFTDQPEDRVYTVVPAFVTSHLWGAAFSELSEGFAKGQIVRGVSRGKPKLVAWKGDGVKLEFLFPTDAQALSVSKITAWVNGTPQTTGVTKALTGLTFTAAPATDAIIVALYETAN